MKTIFRISTFVTAICLSASGLDSGANAQESIALSSSKLIKVERFSLSVMPPSIGVQFYRDGIVFLSSSRNEAKMLESHTSFGTPEVYYAGIRDTTIGNQIVFSASYSWNVPCEAMTFSNDYSLMYYTRRQSNREPEKIYQAKYQLARNGKEDWVSETKPLDFCSDKYAYSFPALSSDGGKLVFTSNRSESIGGLDLFMSVKEGNGWSSPVNLGNTINTRGNEITPYLDRNNNLFYSSDGLEGAEGYDIFLCLYNGQGWDPPVKLTRVINTPGDDIAFKINRLDEKTALFSTRSKTGGKLAGLFKVSLSNQPEVRDLADLTKALTFMAGKPPKPLAMEVKTTPMATVTKTKEETVVTEPPKQLPAEAKPEIRQEQAKTPVQEPPAAKSDVIVFRVQFSSATKPKGTISINVGGREYKTFEYLYNGSFRSCVGEFNSPAEADNLLTLMKQKGYKDAFVVPFLNDKRVPETTALAAQRKLPEPAKPQILPATRQETATAQPDQSAKQPSDAVVYRVQFSASIKPKGSFEINIGGRKYSTFEYLHNGAYRSCAGEFSSSGQAAALQKQLRQEGYPDAFVVAFRNNERISDPAAPKR